jgi:galactokinase
MQRRLRHVITENERVARFAEALSEDDLVTAGRVMSDSHASLRDDYEVSTPELDTLARLAEEQGAYGARLVGGGFGGAVLSLVDSDGAAELGWRIMDEYNGGERDAIVVHPSCGARVLQRSEAHA